MQETMKYLCENVQGCVLGYTQSDEISLLLIDYKTLNSQAFFDYEVQKICSITASMATMIFNKVFLKNGEEWFFDYMTRPISGEDILIKEAYSKATMKGAMFDSRCFNIPESEVTNYFYWREQDASRNSVQMLGRAHFSHKELQNKSCSDIQEMLYDKYNINWNDLPTYQKRGSCCIKESYTVNDDEVLRSHWVIDNDIPMFINEGRDYIEKLIGMD
jgi:tRNA(His) 5'-end guanylyltransferase